MNKGNRYIEDIIDLHGVKLTTENNRQLRAARRVLRQISVTDKAYTVAKKTITRLTGQQNFREY